MIEPRKLWNLRVDLAESLSIIHSDVVEEYGNRKIWQVLVENVSLLQEALGVAISLETSIHEVFVTSKVTEQEGKLINDVFCELPEYIWGISDIISMCWV